MNAQEHDKLCLGVQLLLSGHVPLPHALQLLPPDDGRRPHAARGPPLVRARPLLRRHHRAGQRQPVVDAVTVPELTPLPLSLTQRI